ncbi:MAG TPA: hypothetical protein VLG16_03475 [Candidatus Saccharimonadales bacterium]|nr:hypothetical protein [Candidatus Saccharimonadales bacterium]
MNTAEAITETKCIDSTDLNRYAEGVRQEFFQSSKFDVAALYGGSFGFCTFNIQGHLGGTRFELPANYVDQHGIDALPHVRSVSDGAASYYYYPPESAENYSQVLEKQSYSGDTQKVFSYKLDVSSEFDRAPKEQTVSELAAMVMEIDDPRDVVFITGSGLSETTNSSSVPSYETLKKRYGIGKDKEAYEAFARKFLTDSQHADQVFKEFAQFTESLWDPEPTLGHIALAGIVKSLGCKPLVLTNNYDLKHEGSGIVPVRKYAMGWLDTLGFQYLDEVKEQRRKQLGSTMAKLAEHVRLAVIIGCASDNNGYLRYLKEQNPRLNIAALNLTGSLPYLDSNDSFIAGNVQHTLPKLAQAIYGF